MWWFWRDVHQRTCAQSIRETSHSSDDRASHPSEYPLHHALLPAHGARLIRPPVSMDRGTSMARRTATLPLHSGSAPRWLFDRMVDLGQAIAELIIDEHGPDTFLERLADPYWFQALGCTLGFDWHSSGLTTTTMGALKAGLDPSEHGIAIAGGKGATSRQTPTEIEQTNQTLRLGTTVDDLQFASRMSAKVDNACIHDGYTLYHHTMAFTESGNWCVVQQGMDDHYARRYHWLAADFTDFIHQPHTAICAMQRHEAVLDLTAPNSAETRQTSLDLINDNPTHLKQYITDPSQQTLQEYGSDSSELTMPTRHQLSLHELSDRSLDQLHRAYEIQPQDYEELVGIQGIGPASIRALALIAELVYGAESSWDDPAKYAYAHGGKDGTPYPVRRDEYDTSIEAVRSAVLEANLKKSERREALQRLNYFMTE